MGKSIRARIILWYMLTVILIATACIVLLYVSSNKLTKSIIKERLMSAAELAVYDISLTNDEISVNRDLNEFGETLLLVYDRNGVLVYGRGPSDVINLTLEEHTFHTIKTDGKMFYFYDYLDELNQNGEVWIRCYISLSTIQLFDKSMMELGIIIIPLLIISTIGGGIFITKKAFHPINVISAIAKEISDSGDLTKRIELNNNNKDELSLLADTFNEMFEKLLASFESERQFTSDASHELRTPIAVIMAQAEYLNEKYKKLMGNEKREEEEKAVEIILRQIERMHKLINQLLLISRMENKKMTLNKEEVNLSELAQLVKEEMEEQAFAKNITIEIEVQENIIIQADQAMMMRIFINLISNAIKYGKEGGWVKMSVKSNMGCIIGSVADNGIGIAAENIDKIWQRFYQVDDARTSIGSGSGLGLFMVKWILEQYNGKIDVKSQLGKGSEFVFYINNK